jgi:hypothetical protein
MPEISCEALLRRLWYLVLAPCSDRDDRLSKVVDPRLDTLAAPDDIALSHRVFMVFFHVLELLWFSEGYF